MDAGHQGGAAGLRLPHGLGAIGQLLWMQRSTCLFGEHVTGVGWSASRGCSYVGTPAPNCAGWREAEPNRSEARFQALVCVSSDSLREGMTEHIGATVATQTQRQIVVAVDDSRHIRTARGFGWLRTSSATKTKSSCSTASPPTYVHTYGVLTRTHNRQLFHPCHGVEQGGVQRDVTANPTGTGYPTGTL